MLLVCKLASSSGSNNNPYTHSKILDKDGRYQLDWTVNWEYSRIYFNVTVKTKGYIGFGLSRKGKMSGADIVIGGVLSTGQPYFSARHAVGNQLPVMDNSQDWSLHAAKEQDDTTFLSFSRPFETCDQEHDLEIHADIIGAIWAFGETDDEIEYHFQNRGVTYEYLLDPDLTPREFQKLQTKGETSFSSTLKDGNTWRIPGQQFVPARDTTYLCSIHQAPTNINSKQHAIAVIIKIFRS